MTLPLLVTLGDPGGLGPELALRLFAERPPSLPVVLVGSAAALQAHASTPALRAAAAAARPLDRHAPIGDLDDGLHLLVPPGVDHLSITPGRPTPAGGLFAGRCLNAACDLLLTGRAAALVTAPLHKAMLKAAGFDFPGHTEFLARRAGLEPDDVTMHLRGPRLAVSLVTTHPPLRDVPRLVNARSVERALRHTCAFMARLGRSEPVAVCGLNPHAGEGGTIGDEETAIIGPAVERARADGLTATGPLPADTVFHRAARGEFSAVLAMYHDQGLGPLKLLHFGEAVNVTLGLPFVRCSPDHGTGFDLVGTGQARLDSFRSAVDLALRLALSPGKHI